jgi:hypothetical protein
MRPFLWLFLLLPMMLQFSAFTEEVLIVGLDNFGGSGVTGGIWIRDLDGNIIPPGSIELASSGLFAIAVSATKSYNAGSQGDQAILWTTNLDGTSPTTIALTNNGVSGSPAFANGVAISPTNNNIYIVGRAYFSGVPCAALWITDSEGVIQSPVNGIQINAGGSNAIANAVVVSSTKVYIVGNIIGSPNTATLWITDLDGGSPSTHQLQATASSAVDVALSTTNAYIVGLDSSSGTDYAGLWITDLNGTVTSGASALLLDGSNASAADGIAVSTLNVPYIVGRRGAPGGCNPTLWITNAAGFVANTTSLDTTPGSGFEATDIVLSSTNAYIVGKDGDGDAPLWITNLFGSLISATTLATSGEADAVGIAISFETPPPPPPTPPSPSPSPHPNGSNSSANNPSCVVPPSGPLYDINRLKRVAREVGL